MKKVLIIGLVIITICPVFTSCSHESSNSDSGSTQSVEEIYETAFINRFGNPSKEADWGFGPSTTQTSTNENTAESDEPFKPVVRVIAENMGDQIISAANDFDFNDVVFDVTYVEEGKVRIKILAAGCTLPLTVGWNGQDESKYRDYEIHNLLGYSETMIINTNSNVGNPMDNVPPYEFEFTGTFRIASFCQDVRDNIPVKVRRKDTWYSINAEPGKAPAKLCVGTDYEPWCDEGKDIDEWWQDSKKQGLFFQYTQAPAKLTKYWYRLATRYQE
jgi:hypothetical protein